MENWKQWRCSGYYTRVFLQFIHNIDTYSDNGKPRAFLHTVSKNLCINWHKKYKPYYLETSIETVDTSASDMINNITDKINLEYLVKQLPIEQQEVIVLRYGHELKINE